MFAEYNSRQLICNIYYDQFNLDFDFNASGKIFKKLKKKPLKFISKNFQIFAHPGQVTCIFLTILFQYFSLTNFCWMLVEGKLLGSIARTLSYLN